MIGDGKTLHPHLSGCSTSFEFCMHRPKGCIRYEDADGQNLSILIPLLMIFILFYHTNEPFLMK